MPLENPLACENRPADTNLSDKLGATHPTLIRVGVMKNLFLVP